MAGRHPADESKLIDDYLVALRNDPDAPPPPGLDAKTAAFLRQLSRAESGPTRLEPGQHARIWHKALGLAATPAHQPRPGHNRFIRNRPGDSSMFASPQTRQRPGVHLSAPGVLLPVAVVLVILFVAVIVRFSPSGPYSGNGGVPPLGAGNEQAQRETATSTPPPTLLPTASPVIPVLPTASPFPVTLPAPLMTPTVVAPFDMATPSPFPRTVVPPEFTVTATPILVPAVAAERAIRMNSSTRDELAPERPLVTYRLPVEEDGWVAVAVRPDDPSLDLTLSYDLAQLEPEAGAPNGGGGGGAGGGSLPLDEIGLFSYASSGSILSLTVGADNISVLGRSYFTLSIYQQDPVAIHVAQPAQAALSSGQQAAMFVIETSANQLVDLNVESDGRANLYLNVLEIDGETEMAGHIYRGPIIGCVQGQPLFCMDQDGGVRRDPELTDVTLLEGRRYVIVVRALELNAETEFTLGVSPR